MVCHACHVNQICNNDIDPVCICIISTMSRLAQAESGRRYIHGYKIVYKSSFSIHLRHRYILLSIMITVCVCFHVTYDIWYIILIYECSCYLCITVICSLQTVTTYSDMFKQVTNTAFINTSNTAVLTACIYVCVILVFDIHISRSTAC